MIKLKPIALAVVGCGLLQACNAPTAQRPLAESGYRTLDFPFAELEPPRLHLELEPTAEELCGYLRTWSATWRYIRRTGSDPVADVAVRLERWWPAGTRKLLRWPLLIRAGVKKV